MTRRIPLSSQPPSTAEIVVVGGGVVGAATAFFLSRAGFEPLILESRPQLCTLTTPASTGAFRLQFDNEEELRLVRRSVDLFLNFAEMTGQSEYDLGISQPGYLWLTTSEERAVRQRHLVALQHSWGQTDVEMLSGEAARQRFPYLSSKVVQARFRAEDGFLDPKALTMGLALASGARVVTSCTVTGFVTANGGVRAVETTRGTIDTDLAVIAAGPLSGPLAGSLGVTLPVETVIRQKLVMPDVPEVPPGAPMTIDDDTGAHWRPAFRGAYLLCTDPTTPASPPTDRVPHDPTFAFRLLNPASPVAVSRVAPFWERVWERNSAHWMLQAGQYTMTPDHRPLIGSVGVGGLLVNTGYSGHGIMAGPAGSMMLTELLVGSLSERDNPFRPRREFVPRDLDVL